MNGLNMPTLEKMGLSNIHALQGIAKSENPTAFYGMMQEASVGKDTMTGHWEIMVYTLTSPLKYIQKASHKHSLQSLKKQQVAKCFVTYLIAGQP